jgi:hypothetical protein
MFQEAWMALKNVSAMVILMTLLTWNSRSVAEQYRADQFLGLDLSKAALSPKPLGPASAFEPVPAQAATDPGSDGAQAQAEPKADPTIVVRKVRVVHLRAQKPRGHAPKQMARRHGNPLDAQAFDTRIQVWPCKSGGICNWRPERD